MGLVAPFFGPQCYKIFENRLKQSSTKFPRETRSHTSGPAALGSVVSIEVVRSRRCLHAQRRPGSNGVRCCTRRRNACPTEDSVRYGPGTGRSHAAEAWFRAHAGYHTRTRLCSIGSPRPTHLRLPGPEYGANEVTTNGALPPWSAGWLPTTG